MIVWEGLVRTLVFPGWLGALLLGGSVRGIAAWLGARARRQMAPPPWQPFSELWQLAGKEPPRQPRPWMWIAGSGLAGLVALTWGLGLLPWPQGFLATEELPGSLILYLSLLAVPALIRMVASGLSGSPGAALGTRRHVASEIARLLPLAAAVAAWSLWTNRPTLSHAVPLTWTGGLLATAAAAVILAALPWPLWDHDEHDGPLAGLGGRVLAIFRAVESLELAAQIGLIAVLLRASSLLPPEREGWALLIATAATIVVLAVFEARDRRILLSEAARWYTRWLLPVALALVGLGWWFHV